jgi:hypothetical protein
MGLFDKLKGVRKPEEGTPQLGVDEVRSRLLAIAHDQVPFTVEAGGGGKEGDVVVQWRIVDAAWYEIFAKAKLEKVHRILIVLDEGEHEARVLEEAWEVSWTAGLPTLSASAEKFQGRTMGTKSFGTAYGWKGVDPLDYGKVYEYRFDVSEMKDPLSTVVTQSGWTWVPVTTKGKLAG